VADPQRRARLEQSPVDWLRHYLPATYALPFERPHLELIHGAMSAIRDGGRYAIAAERGIGKSSVLWGLALYLVMSVRSRFPVLVAWSERAARRALAYWRACLCYSDELLADYPDICLPFRASRGSSQRIAVLWWADTGEPTHAALRLHDGIIELPDRLGGLGAASIGGNARGLSLPLAGGGIQRPTLALVDDVQDREVARSPARVRDTIERIDADIAAMGQAGQSLPVLMAANCIAPDDVAAHYLGARTWRSSRIPCITAWPDGFHTQGSPARTHWDAWYDLALEDKTAAVSYFEQHRAEMVAGMTLSAPSFLHVEPFEDPYEAAMWLYYTMGHDAFFAERQQSPVVREDVTSVVRLTREALSRKITDASPLEIPPWAALVIASSDVNWSYAISTVVVAFGRDQSAQLIWYGMRPLGLTADMSLALRSRAIYSALTDLGRQLAHTFPRLHAWAIDAGGALFDLVTRFADASPRVARARVLAMTGRASHRYVAGGRTVLAGDVREHVHGCADTRSGRTVRWVVWDADYWAEAMQLALSAQPGTPGGLTIARMDARELCDQLLAVRLAGKAEIAGRVTYRWTEQPGRHDLHDALAQAYAAAAYLGIGTVRRAPRRRRETRVCKVPVAI